MEALDLVKLTSLMTLTNGRTEIVLGLIDGPVATDHPDLSGSSLSEISASKRAVCAVADSSACQHGTFVAGILCARRESAAPAICPGCTLLLRPIFAETLSAKEHLPSATPAELAEAIIECIGAGARAINMSLSLTYPSSRSEQELEEALDYAARRGVIVVAAAGNQATIGSSIITRHPWVIAVVACGIEGRPLRESNLGGSIGRQGLRAPGEAITSLGVDGQTLMSRGTSIAAPFVTGAIALLWSQFPTAHAAQIKFAITQGSGMRRATIVPPLLDAWAAYQTMIKGMR